MKTQAAPSRFYFLASCSPDAFPLAPRPERDHGLVVVTEVLHFAAVLLWAIIRYSDLGFRAAEDAWSVTPPKRGGRQEYDIIRVDQMLFIVLHQSGRQSLLFLGSAVDLLACSRTENACLRVGMIFYPTPCSLFHHAPPSNLLSAWELLSAIQEL